MRYNYSNVNLNIRLVSIANSGLRLMNVRTIVSRRNGCYKPAAFPVSNRPKKDIVQHFC